MKKVILLVATVSAAVSSAALADNTLVQKEIAAVPAVSAEPAAKPAARKASQAVRLSDAELDKITAGDATQIATGHGFTVILNPGNANVIKFHKTGLTCINCFTP